MAAVGLFCLGVALGLGLVDASVPVSEPPLLAERLSEFDADRDTYDLLFFGSSRVFRGVDPVVFDEQMASRGHPIRSFNLGFPAMRPHEANALLRRVLEDRPVLLRYVVLELADWEPQLLDALPDERFVNNGRYTARAIAWHDLVETRSVLRSVWRGDSGLREKVRLSAVHLSHWGARAFRVGEAALALRRSVAGAAPPADPRGPTSRGYTPFVPEDYREGFASYFRRQFESSIPSYLQAVGGLASANAVTVPLGPYNLEALQAQIAAIRAAGAEPIYLLPSRGDPTPLLHRVARDGHVPALLSFANPEVDPSLFEVGNRFDSQHLSPVGAELFSRGLADRFADWLEAR